MRKWSIDTNTKILQLLKLSDMDSKAAIIKMLQWAIANTFEINEVLVSEKNKRYKAENGNFRTEE